MALPVVSGCRPVSAARPQVFDNRNFHPGKICNRFCAPKIDFEQMRRATLLNSDCH